MTNEEHIENVITRTFEIVKKVYDNQQELNGKKGKDSGSRIIFPLKRGNETRISEQELRFIFVEQLNKEIEEKWDIFYSVETPTRDTYLFKGENPDRKDDGQSANFDLVIHDSSFKRIALIEFKANNPDIHDYQKDFVKLTNKREDSCFRYFIQLLQNTRTGKDEQTDTMQNIKKKKINVENEKKKWGPEIVQYRCYSLEKGNREFNKDDVIRKAINKWK